MTTSDLAVTYEPRGAARELFRARDGEVLLDGPAGTGKSLAALYRLHLACLKHPRLRCLIVRKTGVSLTSTTLVTFDEKVAAEALSSGLVKWYGGSQREAAAYRYANGSRIVVGGMDKPDKVMSSEYDLVFADEATELTVEDWEKLGTRLRNGRLPWQQQLAACNPSMPTHWINQRANEGKMRRLVSRHTDNPRYVQADGTPTQEGETYLARLDNLTGVTRMRLRDGIWAGAEGLVFEDYDPAVHLVDRFDIPQEWTRWWSVDFGFTNPFVCQMWAEDGDGNLYLYREVYMTKRTVDQHAETIAKLVMKDPVKPEALRPSLSEPWKGEWTEPKPRAIVADHDAEGRTVFTRELGLSTVPAHKAVTETIEAAQKRFRNRKIFIFRDAVVERDPDLAERMKPCCTAEEIVGYIWDVTSGVKTEKIKEVPRKEDDHGCDALRYLVAHRDLKGRTRVRWM